MHDLGQKLEAQGITHLGGPQSKEKNLEVTEKTEKKSQ